MQLTDPAYWTEQLRHTLQRYDETLLRQVSARLFRPRNQWPAEELIDRSLAAVHNPAVIDRRLKELEPGQRRLLALIGHSRLPSWHLGNLIEMLMALGDADGIPPILGLLESGMLYPCLADGIKRLKQFEQWLGQAGTGGLRVFAHPLITSRALGEDLGLPDLSIADCRLRIADSTRNSPFAIRDPQSHQEADGLDWPLRLAVLWQQVSAGPLRRTQQGSFFKRDLERLTQDPLLNDAPPDRLGDYPAPGLLAAALGEILGILEESRGEIVADKLPPAWNEGLLPTLADLWSAVLQLEWWNPLDGAVPATDSGGGNPYPSAYLLALLLLARLPAEQWTSPAAVEQWLFAHHPYWASESVRPSRRRTWLGGFLLGLAYQLRIVRARKDATGQWLVQLSGVGRWLLGLAAPPEVPGFPQSLLVQPNLEIIAYRQGLTPGLIAQLSRLADWKNLGAACLLQLGPASIYQALQSGLPFQEIVNVLERHGMRPLPPTVIDSLRTWADKRERISVYPSATLFEFASEESLNDALARGLPGQRISSRLAVVADEGNVDFRHFRLSGTRDYSLPPEKCVEVDDDGVTLSIDPSRADLLVETEISRFAEPLDRGDRRAYRITLASATAARHGGMSLHALEDWFVHRTGRPISSAARLLITAPTLPAAALRRHLVLHLPSEEAAAGLLQWPVTRSLIAERLGPAALTVAEENAGELRTRLQELGIRIEE